MPVSQSVSWLRFQRPLIKPYVRFSRIRLSEFPLFLRRARDRQGVPSAIGTVPIRRTPCAWDIACIPARAASRLALRCSLSWSSRTISSGVLGLSFDIQSPPVLPSISSVEQPEALRSAGVTPFHRYYRPLRLLPRPGPFSVVSLAKRPEVMRFGCGPPPLRGRSPELRSRSVPTCRPDDPAAAPCRLRLLHGMRCQPSSDAQGLGLRIHIYRGSYGFTWLLRRGVTARRFATATPCGAGGLTRRT